VIVFTSTKIMADRVARRLEDMQHKVAVMHADRSQKERIEALEGFKSGKYEVLVATDVAARGLDVQNVSHVINFDVPGHPEDYVHRIGRTGRAQKEGDAFTIFSAEDLDHVRAIERFINQPIERKKLENFNYLYTALFNETAIAPGGSRGGRTLKGSSFGAKKRR
jgi:ATP-dependent RNA helicase RhlE